MERLRVCLVVYEEIRKDYYEVISSGVSVRVGISLLFSYSYYLGGQKKKMIWER